MKDRDTGEGWKALPESKEKEAAVEKQKGARFIVHFKFAPDDKVMTEFGQKGSIMSCHAPSNDIKEYIVHLGHKIMAFKECQLKLVKEEAKDDKANTDEG